jgi:hypothetical protein
VNTDASVAALSAPPWKHFPRPVELRTEHANEQLLPRAGHGFAWTFIVFDTPHAVEKSDNVSRQALGIGDAIRAEAPAQVLRASDIQDAGLCTAHEIHARPLWQITKERFPEPLNQRRGWRKKPELPNSHSRIEGRGILAGKSHSTPAKPRAADLFAECTGLCSQCPHMKSARWVCCA